VTAPANIRELLPLYTVNALAPDEAAQVERAVESDPALAAELDS
jgi:anti-sigma factor RsiW